MRTGIPAGFGLLAARLLIGVLFLGGGLTKARVADRCGGAARHAGLPSALGLAGNGRSMAAAA